MSTLVKHFGKNQSGRDFIVGDIHGCFTKLQSHLDAIGFNPESGDRLFSVGDLVDRGPDCNKVLEWLDRPWFNPVQGNHEDMAIRWPNGNMVAENYLANGGAWNMANMPEQSRAIADALSVLPVAIEIETSGGLVGIVHADVPHDSWPAFVDALTSDELSKSQRGTVVDAAQWSRRRIEQHIRGEAPQDVEGVRAVIVGHTPLVLPTWVGNVLHIDTAGWHHNGWGFTVVEADTLDPVTPPVEETAP